MADNVRASAGTNDGAIFATDEVGSVHYTIVKLAQGALDTATLVTPTVPLPVSNSVETSQMVAANVAVTPKFASVSVASSGDNSVVAAVTSKKIRVLAYVLVADAAVAVKWRNGSTDVSGAMSFASNGGASAPFNPVGWFETSVTTALQLNLGSAVGVRGHITYVEV